MKNTLNLKSAPPLQLLLILDILISSCGSKLFNNKVLCKGLCYKIWISYNPDTQQRRFCWTLWLELDFELQRRNGKERQGKVHQQWSSLHAVLLAWGCGRGKENKSVAHGFLSLRMGSLSSQEAGKLSEASVLCGWQCPWFRGGKVTLLPSFFLWFKLAFLCVWSLIPEPWLIMGTRKAMHWVSIKYEIKQPSALQQTIASSCQRRYCTKIVSVYQQSFFKNSSKGLPSVQKLCNSLRIIFVELLSFTLQMTCCAYELGIASRMHFEFSVVWDIIWGIVRSFLLWQQIT